MLWRVGLASLLLLAPPIAAAEPVRPLAEQRDWKRFLLEHWRRILRRLAIALLAVVVLQNVEPTRIDVLFSSIAEVPKPVLILAAMLIAIAVWEIPTALRSP